MTRSAIRDSRPSLRDAVDDCEQERDADTDAHRDDDQLVGRGRFRPRLGEDERAGDREDEDGGSDRSAAGAVGSRIVRASDGSAGAHAAGRGCRSCT